MVVISGKDAHEAVSAYATGQPGRPLRDHPGLSAALEVEGLVSLRDRLSLSNRRNLTLHAGKLAS